jgi:hypothetical protein
MKKLIVLLAALAAISAIVAGSAFAGASPTTCGSNDPQHAEQLHSTVLGNLTVPAGTWCVVGGNEIKGVANVYGHLISFGATFDTNVVVDGGSFQGMNGYTTILGNLNISNSAGDPNSPMGGTQNGFWGPGNRIAKNLNLINSPGFYTDGGNLTIGS